MVPRTQSVIVLGITLFGALGLAVADGPIITPGEPLPVPAPEPVPVPLPMLIYCDASPGALPHLAAWQELAPAQGVDVVYAEDAQDFEGWLGAGAWSRVLVLANYTSAAPAYLPALQAYAQQSPATPVEFFLWHNHGTQPAANSVVVATTAHVFWQSGRTTVSYADVANADPAVGQAQTTSGCAWPTFGGIQTVAPLAVAEVPVVVPLSNPGLCLIILIPILADDCQAECLNDYSGEIADCAADRDLQQGQCDGLYGPEEGDPGDPDQYAQCIAQAATDYSNCVSGAVHRYNNCLKLCLPVAQPVQPQTAE